MIFSYHGIQISDLSTYQDSPVIVGHVDYHKMKAWGFRAVGIRAGIGNFPDADFEINWTNSRGILPRFTYFAHDPAVPPKTQAAKYWDIIKGEREGPCVFDCEKDGPTDTLWRQWYDLIEEFQRLSGLSDDWIWIYTGFYFWEKYMLAATEEQRAYFKRYPLWIAAYTQDPFKPNYSGIRVPRPWTTCVMLQSGTPAIGLEAGVESKELDYNQWNGDEESFSKYFWKTEPPPEPIGDTMKGTVRVGYTIKVRNADGSETGKLLKTGDTVYGDETNNRIYYDRIYRANNTIEEQPGNSAVRDATQEFMILVAGDEPTQPPASLPVLQVTVSGDGYTTQIVELRPK